MTFQSFLVGHSLATYAQTLVDIHDSNVTLRVGSEEIAFGVDQATKFSRKSDDEVFYVNTFEEEINDIIKGMTNDDLKKEEGFEEEMHKYDKLIEEECEILEAGEDTICDVKPSLRYISFKNINILKFEFMVAMTWSLSPTTWP